MSARVQAMSARLPPCNGVPPGSAASQLCGNVSLTPPACFEFRAKAFPRRWKSARDGFCEWRIVLPLNGVTVVELGHSVAAPYAGADSTLFCAPMSSRSRRRTATTPRSWAPPYWGHDVRRPSRASTATSVRPWWNLKDAAESERGFATAHCRAGGCRHSEFCGPAPRRSSASMPSRFARPQAWRWSIARSAPSAARARSRTVLGYDPLMQAFGGPHELDGRAGPARPVRVGTSIIDMAAGMWSVIGVARGPAAAARRSDRAPRRSTPRSMRPCSVWMCYHAANFQASGEVPKSARIGVASMIVPLLRLRDEGRFHRHRRRQRQAVCVAGARFRPPPGMDRLPGLSQQSGSGEQPGCAVSGRDPRNWWRRHGAGRDWQDILDKAGVPNAPMQTIAEVLEHPQTKALGMLQQSPDGDITLLALPISFDGVRPAFRHAADARRPHQGNHGRGGRAGREARKMTSDRLVPAR